MAIIFNVSCVCVSQDLGDALRATEDASDWLIGGNGRSNSHVVLHDRLMTDALLGNAPIKAEHSYCTTHGSSESLDAIGESRRRASFVAGFRNSPYIIYIIYILLYVYVQARRKWRILRRIPAILCTVEQYNNDNNVMYSPYGARRTVNRFWRRGGNGRESWKTKPVTCSTKRKWSFCSTHV